VTPFHIRVEQAVLDDLNARLAATRWPDAVDGVGWMQGADLAAMQGLAGYWREAFDWRRAEARLNAFPQYRCVVDGVGIHFVHVRGRGPRPLPLVLTHGWPGSFIEFLDLLPRLTDPEAHGGRPEDAFDVVVPSMPGFGFSDRPRAAGMNVWRMADLWAGLMTRLGYGRFAAHGGDFGAGVTTALGLRHPERLVGLHLNYIPGSYAPDVPAHAPLTDEERGFLAAAESWYAAEGGYAHLQATTPQTAGFALNDSPAGLMAWIVEKFRAWGDCEGDLERRFDPDTLLTNVMIYWITGTIASANRLYWETRRAPMRFAPGERVNVPCGIARFPREAPFPPRAWVERGYDVRRWTDMPSGGHFAALEEPVALAADLHACFREWRDGRGPEGLSAM
jgi:microsomal epoxide hydrolase